MELDYNQVAAMEPALAREVIPVWLASYVDGGPEIDAAFAANAREALARTTDEELRALLGSFVSVGEAYQRYPAQPAARRVSRACMPVLVRDAVVRGLDRLREVARGPCLLLSNHLSYVDTQVTDLLLARLAGEEFADGIYAVAGPKVYGSSFRRLAAISLNTLKTAQPSGLATNEAGLSPREVGRIALATVEEAGVLMAEGHPVLIYAEGSRTRTGRLQPFVRAVSRYAALPDVMVVPVAIGGTDELFPLDARTMRPASVQLTFCEPFPAAELGAKAAIDEAWRRVAAALPERHQPAPETQSTT